MDLILVFISLALLVSYVLAVCFKFGIPYSLSESFYLLKHENLFTLFLFLIVAVLMPAFIDYSRPYCQVLGFLPAAALAFVAAAPHYKEKDERKIHVGATAICALSSQAWVIIHQPWCMVLWLVYIIYMIIGIVRLEEITRRGVLQLKPTFWVEMTAFAVTYLALIITALS